jgi:hypothetical protein
VRQEINMEVLTWQNVMIVVGAAVGIYALYRFWGRLHRPTEPPHITLH